MYASSSSSAPGCCVCCVCGGQGGGRAMALLWRGQRRGVGAAHCSVHSAVGPTAPLFAPRPPPFVAVRRTCTPDAWRAWQAAARTRLRFCIPPLVSKGGRQIDIVVGFSLRVCACVCEHGVVSFLSAAVKMCKLQPKVSSEWSSSICVQSGRDVVVVLLRFRDRSPRGQSCLTESSFSPSSGCRRPLEKARDDGPIDGGNSTSTNRGFNNSEHTILRSLFHKLPNLIHPLIDRL